MAKRLWELFYTFAKVGVMTFGGGYAMLPILQREVVENKGWATEEELAEGEDFMTHLSHPNILRVGSDGGTEL